MFKNLSEIFRKADEEVCSALGKLNDKLDKANDKLDKNIEKNIKKLGEVQKDCEEHERKTAKEAGFETVEEWRQHVDKMIDDIMKR